MGGALGGALAALCLLGLASDSAQGFQSQAALPRRAWHATAASRPIATLLRAQSGASTATTTRAEEFTSAEEHGQWLKANAELPLGFRVGTASLTFDPVEVDTMKDLPMQMTLVVAEEATETWAAMFTKNAFPGAPVTIGKARLSGGGPLQAIVINNKISNVCAGGEAGAGVAASERICRGVSESLGLTGPEVVLPCSTGIIGWSLPVEAMLKALPDAVSSSESSKPKDAADAAEAIMTTDRYPKLRSRTLASGARVVGFAKGAGMIEPHLATMLVYILTDADVAREELDQALHDAVEESFNRISVDSDESTSDTVVAMSTRLQPAEDLEEFRSALTDICSALADDVVRNGEGTNHVIKLAISGAPSKADAVALGRSVVNSPLFKCAVAGNDPNVGRLVAAVGKFIGDMPSRPSLDQCRMRMGGRQIFSEGRFDLSPQIENELVQHMASAELGDDGEAAFPRHKRTVDIEVDLGAGDESATLLGSDLTHAYVTVNADYRS